MNLKKIDKGIKKMDFFDIGLTKLSVAAFVLFVLNAWPAAMNLVKEVHWLWFLVLAAIFAIRPCKKVFF